MQPLETRYASATSCKDSWDYGTYTRAVILPTVGGMLPVSWLLESEMFLQQHPRVSPIDHCTDTLVATDSTSDSPQYCQHAQRRGDAAIQPVVG
jgi:hypothetical protein